MKKLMLALLMFSGIAFAAESGIVSEHESYVCPSVDQTHLMVLLMTSEWGDVDPNGDFSDWDSKANYELQLWPRGEQAPVFVSPGVAHTGDTYFSFTADLQDETGPITTSFYLDEEEVVTLSFGTAGAIEYNCMTLAEFNELVAQASE